MRLSSSSLAVAAISLLAAAVVVVGIPIADDSGIGTTTAIPRACSDENNNDMYKFCNVSFPLEDRVEDLISRLDIHEKATLLIARNSPKGTIPRLGIPEYDWGGNCLHGVQSRCLKKYNKCPTSFPMPNGMGATFNTTVWRSMGQVMGTELRALWLHGAAENHDTAALPHIGLDCWSPNIEITRDPRWGRNSESPSEDPTICGAFGREVVQGLQHGGDDEEEEDDSRYLRAIATLKHFVGNSLEGDWEVNKNDNGTSSSSVIDRRNFNAIISDYDLFSTYLRPFREAVVNGKAHGIMCSYNRVNGIPSCANERLLRYILRDNWGFNGYVVTDSGAINDFLPNHHNYVHNLTDAVIRALLAGCDMESASWHPHQPWSTGGPYQDEIPVSVKGKMLNEDVVDRALKHVLMLRFRLGLFDPIEDQPYWHVPVHVIGSHAHHDVAKDATRQSLVLLQNLNQTLPFRLDGTTKVVAVIGPHCHDRRAILGTYLGQMCSEGFGSVSCVKTVYEAIDQLNSAHGGGTTSWSQGCGVNSTLDDDDDEMDRAVHLAANADYVVYVGGLDSTIEREKKDRHDISLPGPQVELLHKVCTINKNTVAVLFHGGIITLDETILAHCSSIVSAGYPGYFGADVLAETLFDTPDRMASNRWGRLAITWYSKKGWEDSNFDMLDFNMSTGRTHRYYTGRPQFPFGHGLTYVPKRLVQVDVIAIRSRLNGFIGIDVRIINQGTRDIDEILFLYAAAGKHVIPQNEPASRIVKEMIGFHRVSVAAGNVTEIDSVFAFGPDQMQLYDARGNGTLYEGEYTVSLESSGEIKWDFPIYCSRERCEVLRTSKSDSTVAID